MLHLLLAGLVMISGSQTTTTTTSHSRIDPVRGSGVVFKVGVQVTHSTPTSPVTLLSAPSNPLYCLVRRKINGMEIVTFVRIQRPQLYAGACQPWTFIP